ncbi:MAG: TonB-dependent receptor [Sphingomonadaceae bacterium]|uniref:TonB-dependent receptor n=1 Tax=Thermaurantiacus sp. TaxID=2820283 RepID=UPI00298EEE41|nr:TonB-dependent receptor [Thermaurantiacus sp.]MCS6987148.1 TonB-dependent receptor [Sphingomonadaceae bacterium]MDW8415818.1 TonB-dependent receptor [Thermaurantiacus sp.]
MRAGVLAAAVTLGWAPAHAQETPRPAAQADAQEIVVTARKREESLQDVPLAITAFGAPEIRDARIERLADLAKLTPGLNFTPLFGAQNQLPIIRGAAQTFGALNVGVFLDGVYLTGKAAVNLELNDLERIEVVKGPQSALYGRNTFAGAINYVTKRPTDVWTADGELSLGTQGLAKVVGGVSGPVLEVFRIRLSGFYRELDGWYRSGIDGRPVDFALDYGGQAVVELEPAPGLRATLRLTYTEEDSGQPASNVVRTNSDPARPAGAPAGIVRNLFYKGELPVIPRNRVTVNQADDPILGPVAGRYGNRGDTLRTNLLLHLDLGFGRLTSLTSWDRRRVDYLFDGDNTVCDWAGGCPNFGFPFVPPIAEGASVFATSSAEGRFEDVAQELRLASTGEGPFAWLLGWYVFDGRVDTRERSLAPVTATTARTFGYPRIRNLTRSHSLFGSATWRPLDWLGLTGELRWETERQTFAQRPTNPAATPGPSTRVFELEEDFQFVTPRVIAEARLGKGRLIYATVAKGAKTGGFNTNLNIRDDQRTYGEETSWNYELGLKSSWRDGRLTFNVAGYYVDWDDQQVACQNPPEFGGTSTQRTYVCNVGQAEIVGVETELSARLTRWLTLAGNYAWTNARYRRFVDDSLASQLALLGRPPLDYDGKRLPYVPEHAFLISPRIAWPLGGDWRLNGRLDFAWQSRSWLRAENFAWFGDRTTLDLRASVDGPRFGLQFFANNLTDDRTPVAGVRFFDAVNFSVQAPLVTGFPGRQFGLALRARL